jgi:hypothetical protein
LALKDLGASALLNIDMDTIMICEYNLQPDLCCLDYGAVEWLSTDGLWCFGAGNHRCPSILIPVILPEEYNVYNYDL